MLESLGAFSLDLAVQAAKNHIETAKQYTVQDIEFCRNYLEAARIAINGLEMEYDQILVQAKYTNLEQSEQIANLIQRLESYLRIDKLRPELLRATTGLDDCQKELENESQKFLQWPWKKNNREKAVKDFTFILKDLKQYLEDLDGAAFEHRVAGSGVGVVSLNRLLDRLKYISLEPLSGRSNFIQLVNEIEQDRTKDNLLSYTVRIEQSIQKLLRAFR